MTYISATASIAARDLSPPALQRLRVERLAVMLAVLGTSTVTVSAGVSMRLGL